jgi:hypothetical protein
MTRRKGKVRKPNVWCCLSCDTDYGRNVKVCPACHVVSPYETDKAQAEITRLRAIESTARALVEWWDTPVRHTESELALKVRDMRVALSGRGPEDE